MVFQVVGLGPHKLLRLLSSDWDDGFHAPADAEPEAESVLTSSLAAAVLPKFAALLNSIDQEQAVASEIAKFAETLRHAVRMAAGNGQWLRRAWLGPNVSWVGDNDPKTGSTLYSAQAGWAMLAGVFEGDPTALHTQIEQLISHCRTKDWPVAFGYRCDNTAVPKPGSGSWPAVNHVTVMGLAAVNYTAEAWREWQLNSLHHQASVFPQLWVGQWTGSDTTDGAGSWGHAGWPGNWTWAFPALCTHRHAWPLVSFPFLAGLRFTATGLDMTPSLDPQLGAYSYQSDLASIYYDGNKRYHGHYQPMTSGHWVIRFDLSAVVPLNTVVDVNLVYDSPTKSDIKMRKHEIFGSNATKKCIEFVTMDKTRDIRFELLLN